MAKDRFLFWVISFCCPRRPFYVGTPHYITLLACSPSVNMYFPQQRHFSLHDLHDYLNISASSGKRCDLSGLFDTSRSLTLSVASSRNKHHRSVFKRAPQYVREICPKEELSLCAAHSGRRSAISYFLLNMLVVEMVTPLPQMESQSPSRSALREGQMYC